VKKEKGYNLFEVLYQDTIFPSKESNDETLKLIIEK